MPISSFWQWHPNGREPVSRDLRNRPYDAEVLPAGMIGGGAVLRRDLRSDLVPPLSGRGAIQSRLVKGVFWWHAGMAILLLKARESSNRPEHRQVPLSSVVKMRARAAAWPGE